MEYLNTNSVFYKNLFHQNKIDYRSIRTLDDLVQLPVTTKDDLQQHNYDFLCVERNEIIDYVTTSGTMGEPVTFAMTNNDLDRLAYNEYISFSCANTTKEDVFQIEAYLRGVDHVINLKTSEDKEKEMKILVFDLGGGTLDVTIMEFGDGVFEVKSTSGDTQLGGTDMDEALMKFIVE